jgi:2-oxoglutarate/2-oxoacid ferredoxin oxidoreductase subunit alpha
MPPTATEARPRTDTLIAGPVLNDVVIKVATQNGSGSQSANLILMRAIFDTGVPVSGKNLFPSNIQGLPTWFTIRANDQGWLAQRATPDIMIAMNADTLLQDIDELPPGGVVVMNEALKPLLRRQDVLALLVPFDKLVAEVCPEIKLRKLVINVLYVGVVSYLLDIPAEKLKSAIQWQFAAKAKAAALNEQAAMHGYAWAQANLEKSTQFRIAPGTAAEGKIIIEGNEAAALGMLFGGVGFMAWYPITPSSSVCEALTGYLEQYRTDPQTGKATYAIVQAEDELASLAMVVGAGWAGARAFTATAGPGLSLMAELAGLCYFAEIPAVIVDVQRMGPSTGLPTRTSQGDMLKAYNLSHGDCKHLLLIPGNVRECYEFAMQALDLAEHLQTLVIVMSDLDLGMNKWLSEPFSPPSTPLKRGKVLDAAALEKVERFARYRDVDGDAIAYRTLPGTNHPKAPYFTRGTGHAEDANYSEDPAVWQANMERLERKFNGARALMPPPVLNEVDGAGVALLAYGSSDLAVEEARHILRTRHGIESSYLRLRALPAHETVRDYFERHDTVYVVEQNRDGQVAAILADEFNDLAPRIRRILHYNGMPLDAQTVVDRILQSLNP